ncbi:MAG TPA: hypothetical protein GXZ82_07955 [Firmicutes bacterium]|nr:hypothetical protein [Bacillota bacterium]
MARSHETHKGKFTLLVMTLTLVFSTTSLPVVAFEGILSGGIMMHGGDTRGYLYAHMLVGRSFMVGLEFNPREYSIAALMGQTSGYYGKFGWNSDGSATPKYTDLGIWGRTSLTDTFTVTGSAGVNRTTALGKYDLKLAAEMIAPIGDYVYFIGGAETGIVTSPDSTKGWLGIGLAF